MDAVQARLSTDLVEDNCREIYAHGVDHLIADATGKLTNKGLLACLSSNHKVEHVAQAILDTLKGIHAQMEGTPPMSFFVQLDWAFNWCHPYTIIADRILESKQFTPNADIQQAAQRVLELYKTLDFGIEIDGRPLTEAERGELNAFVRSRQLTASQGSWTQQRKVDWTNSCVMKAREQLRDNTVWDGSIARNRDRDWVLSGQWHHKPNAAAERARK